MSEFLSEIEAQQRLNEAIMGGDALEIMKAQRVSLGVRFAVASPGVSPQFSAEITKLSLAIADEERRREYIEMDNAMRVPDYIDDSFDPDDL